MAKPFDVTLKTLVEAHPADWVAFAGFPVGSSAQVIEGDLSTLSPAADKVIRVEAAVPYIAHLEFQSGQDPDLDRRMLLYNVLLRNKHGLSVRSAAILLRPQADSVRIIGQVRDESAGETYLDFRYRIVRLWQESVDAILEGGPGTLPLAPISNVPRERLSDVISRLGQRLAENFDAAEVNESWAATFILLGLKYPPEVGRALLSGVRRMKDSTTYQAILAEGEARGQAAGVAVGEAVGRLREAKSLLLRLGTRHFGSPSVEVAQKIEAMTVLETLESLIEQTISSSSWDDLLRGSH